jgi:hypothetical protein
MFHHHLKSHKGNLLCMLPSGYRARRTKETFDGLSARHRVFWFALCATVGLGVFCC